MAMQGRIQTIIIVSTCLLLVGCNNLRNSRPLQSQAPAKQSTSIEKSSDTLDGEENTQQDQEAQVAKEVQEYVNSFDDSKSSASEAHSAPPINNATQISIDTSQLFGSMSPASLDSPVISPKQPAIETKPSAPTVKSISVRAVHEEHAEATAPKLVTANTALDSNQTVPRNSIHEEIEKLQQTLSRQPNDIDRQLRLGHLLLAEGLTDKALKIPTGMDPERSELLKKMLSTTIAAGEALRHPTRISTDTLSAIEELSDWVRSKAELQIPRVALCTSIHSYGRYEVIPPGYFVVGGANRAILYCEVNNFATTRTDDNNFKTKIAHQLELLTPDGRSLWKDLEEMEVVDVCLNRRADFFFNRRWQLPAGINPGNYVLKITLEDKIKSQVSEATLPITVRPRGIAGR